MKKFLVTAASLTLSLPVWGQLAGMTDLPAEFEAEAPHFTEEELLRSWGWLLAERFTLKDLEISPQELDWISAGMMTHLEGGEPPTDLQKSQFSLQEYFAQREVMIRKRQLEQNTREGEEFFDSLFGVPGMRSLATGLFYEIIEPGNDVRPGAMDTVSVHYEGRFLDESIFDSSTGTAPVTFKLNEVIPAWTQAIPMIGEGGKIKMYVPSRLGYGDEGSPPNIPPAATLIFEVELIKVGAPEAADVSLP